MGVPRRDAIMMLSAMCLHGESVCREGEAVLEIGCNFWALSAILAGAKVPFAMK